MSDDDDESHLFQKFFLQKKKDNDIVRSLQKHESKVQSRQARKALGVIVDTTQIK